MFCWCPIRLHKFSNCHKRSKGAWKIMCWICKGLSPKLLIQFKKLTNGILECDYVCLVDAQYVSKNLILPLNAKQKTHGPHPSPEHYNHLQAEVLKTPCIKKMKKVTKNKFIIFSTIFIPALSKKVRAYCCYPSPSIRPSICPSVSPKNFMSLELHLHLKS